MTKPKYDPLKAHQYYERTKQLQGGRRRAGTDAIVERVSKIRVMPKARMVSKTEHLKMKETNKVKAQESVVRLTGKLHKLQDALKEAAEALRNKQELAKKNSDGKTTAKERQASKQYRDKHQAEIKQKEKQKPDTPSASKSVSSMSESELTDRVSKLKGLIDNTKQQIQQANARATSLSHSEFISPSGLTAVNTK